jgi:hypothetical protein
MGIFGIFGKGKNNKSNYYDHLLSLYSCLSYAHNLYYHQGNGVFAVITMDRESPWPGIKVHTPLSDEIYNVLMDLNFQHMIINKEIDAIKVYERDSYKQVTFYISFHSIHSYKKLLHIFRAYGIHIEPKLQFHRDKFGSYVLLNRMYIAKDIFVRYSTDFNDRIWNNPKIDDSRWRYATDNGHPYIYAVSKSYLLNHLYNLDYESHHIITFLSLINYDGIIVPIPNIILSLSSNKLITYNIFTGKIIEHDLSTEENIGRFSKIITDHPEERLKAFLG